MSAEELQPPAFTADYESIHERMETDRIEVVYLEGLDLLHAMRYEAVMQLANITIPPSFIPNEDPEPAPGNAFLNAFVLGMGMLAPDIQTRTVMRKEINSFLKELRRQQKTGLEFQAENRTEYDISQIGVENADFIFRHASSGLSQDPRREELMDRYVDEFFTLLSDTNVIKAPDWSLLHHAKMGYGLVWYFLDKAVQARHAADLADMEEAVTSLDIDQLLASLLDSADQDRPPNH